MQLVTLAPQAYLGADDVVDRLDPRLVALAAELRAAADDDVDYARRAFALARDEVRHSWDAQDRRVTVTASGVLQEKVGLCYGKSHLLVALLRTQGIPAGLCYQRLADDGGSFALHGLVAVLLQGRWSRLDPRGNKPGVDGQFSLDVERLAWPVRPELGEVDYPDVLPLPAPEVVDALRRAEDMLVLCGGGLPTVLEARLGPTG